MFSSCSEHKFLPCHTQNEPQNLVFPKLYSCPSGVYRDNKTGKTYGISDKNSPTSGAVSEGLHDFTEKSQVISKVPRA